MAISYGRTDIETPIHADIKETLSHGIIVSNLTYCWKELGLSRRDMPRSCSCRDVT